MGKHIVRRACAAVAGNRVSQCYLTAVSALLLWVAVDTLFVEHADASMAGVVPVLATAPVSVLLVPVFADGPVHLLFAAVVVGALVNATVIGLLFRSVRRPLRRA